MYKYILCFMMLLLGTSVIAENLWKTYDNDIRQFTPEGNILWIYTPESLVRWDRTAHIRDDYPLPGELADAVVSDMVVREDSDVFVATNQKGIFRYTAGEWKHYTQDDGLSGSSFWCIDVDHNGIVWASGLLGVSYYDGYSWKNLTDEYKNLNNVAVMKIDENNVKWFGG